MPPARKPLAPLTAGLRCFGYARDSGGTDQEASVTQQRERVAAWAATQGYHILAWYEDERRPGSTDNREAFLAMVDACCVAKPPVGAVLVWDFSRFSRNESDRAYYPALLERHGVRLVSISQSLPDGPTAGIMREVLAFTDSEYLRQLSRNVKRGLQSAAAQGRCNGKRPPAGYVRELVQVGVHRDGSARLVQRWRVDEAQAPLVREAFRLYAAGATYAEIHAKTNLVTSQDGYRHLFSNPVYVGRPAGATPDPTLRIVDDALFAEAQERRKLRVPPRQIGSPYLLSGLIHCGTCGRRMHGTTHHNRYKVEYKYYRCDGRRSLDAPCCNWIHADQVEKPVLEAVTRRIGTPENVQALVTELQARAERDTGRLQAAVLDGEIGKAERAIIGLLDLAEAGTLALPEIRKRLAEREASLADLRARRAALPATALQVFDAERVRAGLAAIAQALGAEAVPEVRRALAAVVERVVVGETVEVVYRDMIGPGA